LAGGHSLAACVLSFLQGEGQLSVLASPSRHCIETPEGQTEFFKRLDQSLDAFL